MMKLLVFLLAAPLVLLAIGKDDNASHDGQGEDTERAEFARCAGSGRVTCVVDGDTIWYRGTKIRLADINTPEISQPGCARERALGERASVRLMALLNEGSFSLASQGPDEDRYGRKLRVVTRGGLSLGAVLVAEGLAEEWYGHRGNWCT